MPERFDRFESAVHTIRALFSDEAATDAGVTRPDPFYPLVGATNDPAPLTPGGPPIWLGGQKRRGIALAAAVADGWLLPAVTAGQEPDRHDVLRRPAGRDPRRARGDRPRPGRRSRWPPRSRPGRPPRAGARASRRRQEAVRLGATHVIIGMPPRLGAAGVDDVARAIAEPLREAIG